MKRPRPLGQEMRFALHDFGEAVEEAPGVPWGELLMPGIKTDKKQARATDTGVWMVELGKDLLRFFHELAGWPAIHVRPYEKSLSCRGQNLS